MKKELLAPAGSFDSLKAAVNNGADAVYLSGKLFGARKYAPNFNNDELREAVDYCHLYGVKIYVTVNTIIYEDEIDSVLEYLCFLYNIGVDAVIVQDLGLITLIRKYLPDLEIHASTQAHTHNIEQIKLLENLGVKRVVLARELSLEEINNLDTSLELEVFIHGALCISYSGECYFSSFLLNRSGNRGECAGLCRTPFNLIDNDKKIIDSKYLLSPKEFNTTNNFEKLKSSKAISFKIEGRMKSPEYVGYVTSIYRKLLDNDNYILSDEEIFNLKSLYNRGFTKGYLFNNTDSEFISLNSSNHQGVEIGKVVDCSCDKIKIYLTHELNQGDAIRLPNNTGLYDSYIYIDNKCDLKSKGSVLLTINSKLINELKENLKKKIKINCSIYAHIGENLKVSYSDTINNVEYTGDIVSEALNSPISEIRIKEILSKLGNTPFIINKIDLDIDDNIFIPVGVLNEIRRNLIRELINKRTFINRKIELNYKNNINFKRNNDLRISAFVISEEQLKTLKVGGLFHDIGKIGIPYSILQKQAKLTDDEYSEIKNHPSIGEHILSTATIFQDIIPIVKHHHEKYDGYGYPSRLAGQDIPYFARITAIADSFDAMTSKRVYRNSLPLETVITEFMRCRGSQFDPNLTDVFLDILENHFDEVREIQEKYK